MRGIDSIPFWLVFLGTIAIVLVSMDVGRRIGIRRRLRFGNERENATSVISAGLVSLNSFFLAFVFGMAADRYEDRQSLVREDAAAIRMAFLRTDLLPDADRSHARKLLRAYLEERVRAVASGDVGARHVLEERARLQGMQQELWSRAVSAGAGEREASGATTYLDSLDDLIVVDVRRWAVGYESRLPPGVWILLGSLNVLGMFSIGYLVGNSGSRHSFLTPALAVAFATIVTLIAILDRPDGHVAISQQPLLDLRAYLATRAD